MFIIYLGVVAEPPSFVTRPAFFVPSGESAVSSSSKDHPEAENAQILVSWKRKSHFQIG